MAFFQTDPPTEPKPDSEAAASSHSPRTGPLFKQDNTLPEHLSGQQLSLSAYISKHLQADASATAQPAAEPSKPTPAAHPLRQTGFLSANSSASVGQYLNSLDVDLPAGLEQYMPTPVFRLRVAKKRLDGEITELRGRLNKYERLPEQSPELQERIMNIRGRLNVLEAHERKVSRELAASMTFGSLLYPFSSIGGYLGERMGRAAIYLKQLINRLLYGQAYLTLEKNRQTLQGLQELMAERMNAKDSSSAEIGQLLNQYEHTLRQLENASQKISLASLPRRLWQETLRLVK